MGGSSRASRTVSRKAKPVLRFAQRAHLYHEVKQLAEETEQPEPDVLRDILWMGLHRVPVAFPYLVRGPVVNRAITVSPLLKRTLEMRAKVRGAENSSRNSFINEAVREGIAQYRKEIHLFRRGISPLSEEGLPGEEGGVAQDERFEVSALPRLRVEGRARGKGAVLPASAATRAHRAGKNQAEKRRSLSRGPDHR